jgi:hypothetical protein
MAFASTLTILPFASRAFAFYYFPQVSSRSPSARAPCRSVAISLLAVVLAYHALRRSSGVSGRSAFAVARNANSGLRRS